VIDYLRRLFEYDDWAILSEIAALEGVRNAAALKTLAHILAAKQIWLVRLKGQDSSAIQTQPDLSLDECRILANDLKDQFKEFMDPLTDRSLESTITYKNTKGMEFTTPIGEVLTHVAFHSAYHRGQIALLLRQAGDTAVNTDFITFARL
jgi:uncharacterized damage-inducible protein DinB